MNNIPHFCPTYTVSKDKKGYLKNDRNFLMNIRKKNNRTNIGQGRDFFLYLSFLIAALPNIRSNMGGINDWYFKV